MVPLPSLFAGHRINAGVGCKGSGEGGDGGGLEQKLWLYQPMTTNKGRKLFFLLEMKSWDENRQKQNRKNWAPLVHNPNEWTWKFSYIDKISSSWSFSVEIMSPLRENETLSCACKNTKIQNYCACKNIKIQNYCACKNTRIQNYCALFSICSSNGNA